MKYYKTPITTIIIELRAQFCNLRKHFLGGIRRWFNMLFLLNKKSWNFCLVNFEIDFNQTTKRPLPQYRAQLVRYFQSPFDKHLNILSRIIFLLKLLPKANLRKALLCWKHLFSTLRFHKDLLLPKSKTRRS